MNKIKAVDYWESVAYDYLDNADRCHNEGNRIGEFFWLYMAEQVTRDILTME